MWVFDATPLIYLAKVERLTLVDHLEEPCVIPEPVYDEVVLAGVEQGYPDARRIERCVEADRFDVAAVEPTPLASRLGKNSNLGEADVAVLVYADLNDGVAVRDESYGRDVASAEGIQTRGTAFLVLKLVSDGLMDVEEARTVIDGMIEEGWYCAPNVYSTIVATLEEMSE